jgi:hypothetical protein
VNTVVTFDLQGAAADDYEKAHAILAAAGFQRSVSSESGKRLPLPNTTAVGMLSESAIQIRDRVWAQFAAAGIGPKRVFVAKFDDWALQSTA